VDFQVTCSHCRANIGVMASQVGTEMSCPHCGKRVVIGDATPRDPSVPLGKLFSFRCAQCQSRLEAYTGMVGRRAQCPTCAVEFKVPPQEGQVRRLGGTEPEAEYAQPVHAYAAAGDKAPEIVRLPSGQQAIRCARCRTVNSVDRDNCIQCAAPFTLEGSEQGAIPRAGGLATASLVLGIIGLVAFFAVLPPVLAIIFGLMALGESHRGPDSPRNTAIAGIVLGGIGIVLTALYYFLA